LIFLPEYKHQHFNNHYKNWRGLAYRKEVDHIGDLFSRKEKTKKENQTTTPAAQSTPIQQPQNPKVLTKILDLITDRANDPILVIQNFMT
jgi:hypothetical protein